MILQLWTGGVELAWLFLLVRYSWTDVFHVWLETHSMEFRVRLVIWAFCLCSGTTGFVHCFVSSLNRYDALVWIYCVSGVLSYLEVLKGKWSYADVLIPIFLFINVVITFFLIIYEPVMPCKCFFFFTFKPAAMSFLCHVRCHCIVGICSCIHINHTSKAHILKRFWEIFTDIE